MNSCAIVIAISAVGFSALSPMVGVASENACREDWARFQEKDRAQKECLAENSGLGTMSVVACMEPARTRKVSLDILKEGNCSLSTGRYLGYDGVENGAGEFSGGDSSSSVSGQCPNDLSKLRQKITTPELRQPGALIPVDQMIAEAGGLDRAILLTRAQIKEYEEILIVNERSAVGNPAREQFDRMNTATREAIMVNKEYLKAFDCRRRASGR
jgi:hypothetical protein